jgi:opacity protein-like surface antigen
MQMKSPRSVLLLLLCSAAIVAFASPASAQVKHLAGGYLVGSFPMGDWGKVAGFGVGVDGTDIIRTSPGKAFAWRSSLGLLYNFSRTEGVPQANVGANDKLELGTKNWSVFFGLGPELAKQSGPVIPFLYGTAGFDTYWTSSTLQGTAGGSPYSAEHGDSRISFAWAAGVGIRRAVSEGAMGEISIEYRSGLDHEYVLPGEVKASGSAVTADRASRTSDQILVRIGTVLGY